MLPVTCDHDQDQQRTDGRSDGWWTMDRQTVGWFLYGQTKDRRTDGQTEFVSHVWALPLPQAEGGSQVKLGAYRHEDSWHHFKQFNPLKTHKAPLGQTIIPTTAHTWWLNREVDDANHSVLLVIPTTITTFPGDSSKVNGKDTQLVFDHRRERWLIHTVIRLY